MATGAPVLDRQRIRELFDLRSSYHLVSGGDFQEDPYPAWHRLRETGPVHEGTVHELTGYPRPATFPEGLPFPDRPHFSAFSFAACNEVFRDDSRFGSAPVPLPGQEAAGPAGGDNLITMNGRRHRSYRSLVQPSFIPGRAKWWIERWINEIVHGLIDGFAAEGRAELNVDFCAAIPVLTITGSFGISIADALDVRAAVRPDNPTQGGDLLRILTPIIASRRVEPQDDLVSVLVQAECSDEDGVTHQLSDTEIYRFAQLLLGAGSGTTWKQLGIVLTALFTHPEILAAVTADRGLLRPVIGEVLRWTPTDPMFARFVTEDTDFYGVRLPAGSVIHVCVAAANRDPARWDRPDVLDPSRRPQPNLTFGTGTHVCLGTHVARAEIDVAVGALLDRLPGLRLDPAVGPPRVIGMYERGPAEIPVLFDR